MLVPFGLLAFVGLKWFLPPDRVGKTAELDWIGFLALAVAISALQLLLARGVRLDWFQSTEIVVAALVSVLAFYIFIAHCLTTRAQPFLNLRLLSDRNYAVGLGLVTIYGMLNFTPMVLLPPLLQDLVGFPDTLVGQVIGARGVGMMAGFLAAGLLSGIDPRVGMGLGFGLQVVSGLWMLSFDLNVTLPILIANSLIQGFATGVIWVPMSVVAFATLAPEHRPEASAVFHLLRNVGSSLFISLSIAELVRTTGANYSRLSEMITPFNAALSMPWATGGWSTESVAGLARLTKEIGRQAAMIGYLNAFVMYTLASALAVALVMLARRSSQPS
jgi:DHA2 family multidrug resistance protein